MNRSQEDSTNERIVSEFDPSPDGGVRSVVIKVRKNQKMANATARTVMSIAPRSRRRR